MRTLSADRIAGARRALEATYGLALQGLSERQIALALVEEERILDPAEPVSLEQILDRLPIDESWLFRDEDLWTWLENDFAKDVVARCLREGRPVRALSIGCSCGQEVFSLAMLFQDLLLAAAVPPSAAASHVEILGVDPSPGRVAQARAGRLKSWSVERSRPDRLRDRVVLEDAGTGQYRVDDRVRALCRFEIGNLIEIAREGRGLDRFDLVLCRHVLIYFESERAREAVERLSCGMAAGSVLVVAAAESHLLAQARLGSLGHTGAARVAPAASAGAEVASPPGRRPSAVAKAIGPRSRGRPFRRGQARPFRRKEAAARILLAEASGAAPGQAADGHVRAALAHVHDGRSAEAVQEARAALYHDPRHLFSWFLFGKELIAVDDARGRRVLEELLQHISGLPPEGEILSAPGLSTGQMVAATRLLLGEEP